MKLDLSKNWNILQDVHDTCEQLGLPEREDFMTLQGPQISEWEPLPELKHLQLLFSEHPYWGRELRYFNDAPWWYKNEVDHGTWSRRTYRTLFYKCGLLLQSLAEWCIPW